MAWRLGDDTAKNLGRVSLNPIVHIDPIGTLLFPLIQIFTNVPLLGWAKPTPYNPANFRHDVSMRKGHMLVAAAGPVSNFLLALLFTGILLVTIKLGLVGSEQDFLLHLMTLGIELNVLLAVFNLIPIPPLDGSKVASFGLPGDLGERYDRIVGPYGFMILMLLLISGAFAYVVYPVQQFIVGLLYGVLR